MGGHCETCRATGPLARTVRRRTEIGQHALEQVRAYEALPGRQQLILAHTQRVIKEACKLVGVEVAIA